MASDRASGVGSGGAVAETGGLGLFLRSLAGLDRAAAMEAFARFLDTSTHSVEQIRFIEMVIDELTTTGIMEPGRLFESPYSDDLPRVDTMFPDAELEIIADTLRDVRARAAAEGGAA